jgi:hypothetical protein
MKCGRKEPLLINHRLWANIEGFDRCGESEVREIKSWLKKGEGG